MQGGIYNTVLRALERLGLADVYGDSKVPLYVMNVAYPLVDARCCASAPASAPCCVVEEGQPNFIEQNLATILRQADRAAALHGKDMLPLAGEYTAAMVLKGARAFLERYGTLAPEPLKPVARKVIPLELRSPPSASLQRREAVARSTTTCTRGRRAFAPAARSGRSSAR